MQAQNHHRAALRNTLAPYGSRRSNTLAALYIQTRQQVQAALVLNRLPKTDPISAPKF